MPVPVAANSCIHAAVTSGDEAPAAKLHRQRGRSLVLSARPRVGPARTSSRQPPVATCKVYGSPAPRFALTLASVKLCWQLSSRPVAFRKRAFDRPLYTHCVTALHNCYRGHQAPRLDLRLRRRSSCWLSRVSGDPLRLAKRPAAATCFELGGLLRAAGPAPSRGRPARSLGSACAVVLDDGVLVHPGGSAGLL